ncbi:MAG: GNAT family N-acetyltransferase [Janthinobacterium lividum]
MPDLLITRPARPTDVPGLVVLINRAYRGPARRGWTTEADLFDGSRTDEANLRALLRAPYTRLWCCHEPALGLVGCVCLTRPPGEVMHVSLLAVAPEEQTLGVGRYLLLHADLQARHLRCTRLRMSVLAERPDLLEWYARRGYQPTGAIEPFPAGAGAGEPRQPLHLLLLEKPVSGVACAALSVLAEPAQLA